MKGGRDRGCCDSSDKGCTKKGISRRVFGTSTTKRVTKKELSSQPWLDEESQMRCDGRLKHAEFLPQDARFPIILPQKNCVTKLIVKHYHEKDNYTGGMNQLLAALSTRFWIISGCGEIRDPKKRWRRVEELVRHFWHRWIREWLPALNVRRKWLTVERDTQVDDVVLVMSPKDTTRILASWSSCRSLSRQKWSREGHQSSSRKRRIP